MTKNIMNKNKVENYAAPEVKELVIDALACLCASTESWKSDPVIYIDDENDLGDY